MANSDKNIRITPNRNTNSFPKIVFTGQANDPITVNVLDDNSLSFSGSAGQLFSLSNNISSGTIFSVNDISGFPSFRINANGTVSANEFSGNFGIGVSNPFYKLQVSGTLGISGGVALTAGLATTSSSSGTLVVTGGAAIGSSLSVGGSLLIWNGANYSALKYTGSNNITYTLPSSIPGTGTSILQTDSSGILSWVPVGGGALNGTQFAIPFYPISGTAVTGSSSFTNVGTGISILYTANSTSSSTGSLVVSGGLGVSRDVFIGGSVVGGSWAGNLISTTYGGTGYTNYIKGDLLVGAGNTIIKFPSGTDSYVLTSNSSQTSGLAWTAVSSIASTTIGNPNDGLYTDGFFSTWTNSTTIANAFDDVNELLSLIAPVRPGYLTGTSLSAGSVPTFYTVGISAGLGTEWYQAGYGTNSSITRYYISSSAITLNTANTSSIFSAGSLTTSTYGTINFKRFNSSNPSGASYGTIDLSTNYTVGYTNNNLKLTALATYNSIWTKANAQILSYSQTTPGYEGYTIAHTENNQETSIYEVWRDPWTQANPNPIHAQAATASTNSQTIKYLSGIGYYTTGTGFSVYFKGAAGIFSSCYNTTQIYAISATGLVTATGTTSSPLYSGELDKTGPNHVRVTLNSANASSFNKYLTVTLYKAGGGTSNSNAIISRAINTYSTPSTTTSESFQDEVYRLVIGSGIAFTSTIDMANGNAQVRSGTLTYPLAADYDTEYGGSHSFTGDQEYQRYFYKTSASTGSLTFGSFTASNVAAYGTGNLNVLAYLEGDNKWFDLGVQQGSNANDGSSRAVAISAKTSTSSGTLNWSFGVYSTGVAGAGNSARYRVVIIFRNNTYSMTSIASI